MSTLGILADKESYQIELNQLLESQMYQLITVEDKEQIDELDGLVIHLNKEQNLPEVIEWLLFSKSNPNVFIWIFSPNPLDREQEILFELGANDVLSDSESLGKLPYIVKNTFNRIGIQTVEKKSVTRDSFLNEKNQAVIVNEEERALTRIEFRMLAMLHAHLNTTIRYEELFQEVWGKEDSDEQVFRVANVIFHLRRKVKGSDQFEIKTTRSKGYMLSEIVNY